MPVRYVINRVKRFFIYRVLHVDDTPHRIALGVAVGVFIAWTPTIGLQMILTVLLATLVRANNRVGVPFAWISNPFTMIPIYGRCNYRIGMLILGDRYPPPDFSKVLSGHGSWWLEVWANRVRAFWEAIWQALPAVWLGSVVLGLMLGIMSYGAVYYAVVAYRRHRILRGPQREAAS